VPRKSCVEYDFRIYVNCGVEPHSLFSFELNLFLVSSNTVWLSGEVLLIVLSI
jgi:hypothetical protein